MSIDVMKVVWDTSKHKNSRLLAMLCFADHADDDGISWPGIAKLAKRCRLSSNRVVKMVGELEDSREVYVNHGGGAGKSNRYFVTLGKAEVEIAKVLETRMDKGKAEAATIARWVVSGEGARPLVVKKSRRHTPITTRNDGRFAIVIDEKNDGRNAEETMADLPGTMAETPSEPSVNHHENHHLKEEEAPPSHSQRLSASQPPAPEPAPASSDPGPELGSPTDPIDQELVILDLYRDSITPLPCRLEYDSITADALDLSKAGYDPLAVFTYAITQAVGANARKLNYIQAIVKDIRDSNMPLAAYISHRQAKTKRNGGSNGTATRKIQRTDINLADQFDH